VTQPAPSTTPADGGSWVHVADLKDVARRKRKQVEVGGCPIALFLVDDEVFAVDDTCIHQEKSLAKGTLLGGQVICPGHQWRFDPRTGEPQDQDGKLATYRVQVTDDGAVLLDPTPATPRVPTTAESAFSNRGAS